MLPISAAPIRNGGVLVEQGIIRWVGAVREMPPQITDAVPVEALGAAVLMPGLVNAHTHLELTTLRGFLEGFDFRDWLRTLTEVRRDLLTMDDLVDASRVGIAEALRHGITTMADTTDSAAPLQAMHELGVRGIGYVEVFGPDPAQCATSIARLQERVLTLRAQDTSLVQVGVSPHAPYTVSAALFAATATLAREQALPMAVHIAESAAETAFVRDGAGAFAERLQARGIAVAPQARSPIALLDACGVLACRPLLIHAIRVDDEDLARVADRGARIVHCPISNAKLGHGIAPLDRMLAHGVAVGLGSDSVASNDRMHLLDEARQATLWHAVRSGVPDSLDAHTALRLATQGGADALGLGDVIGTLDTGKAADLVAFPLDVALVGPVFDPAVTLVHVLAGRAEASFVSVAGAVLVRNGSVTVGAASLIDGSMTRLVAAASRLEQWRHRGPA
ncbi:amidohydrolase family protein [Gemmatimonas aurantiaca]|uniref:amidohydrolase family protein n=1 Tax=Gemmatimonas aurantiaca TaxID=173480 RepID=UPI0002FA5E6D|nr:amidohydrolase family protein [Gemmatimonas aurantiaca]